MTNPALGDDAVERLRAALPHDESAPPPSAPPAPTGPSGLRAQVKRVIRKAIAWYVDPKAQDTADAAADSAADRVLSEVGARLDEHQRQLDSGGEAELRALTLNLELLKGELRGLQHVLDSLGEAIAPAAGLPGAADRMGELRDRLNALERRTRLANAAVVGPAGGDLGPDTPTHPPRFATVPDPNPPRPSFDYVGFERRFRGDPSAVFAEVKARYFDLLSKHAPVLDVGCGRGELVELLRDAGVEASGVDLDADMVGDAVARGVPVQLGDAVAHLRSLPEASLGAIVSLHVIEHLELAALLELLELAASRLRPGGVFVAETPNPASLIVLGNSYILDPTHVRPLHPSLMVFLSESAGFRDVNIRFFAPAEDYQVPLVDDPDAPAWVATLNDALSRLNTTLFGPQEYAVIATTPPGPPTRRA